MKIIVLLIVISLIIALGFLLSFFWAVGDGQFDDDLTPSMRILVEDDMLPVDSSEAHTESPFHQNKSGKDV